MLFFPPLSRLKLIPHIPRMPATGMKTVQEARGQINCGIPTDDEGLLLSREFQVQNCFPAAFFLAENVNLVKSATGRMNSTCVIGCHH